MCNYCNKENSDNLISSPHQLYIANNELYLVDSEDPTELEVLEINFCPMCGTKL